MKKITLEITKQEKRLIILCGMLIMSILTLDVFCNVQMGSLNMSVEKLRGDIQTEEKKIETLSMKVSELTSFDNVKNIVKDMGLAYNNNSIVNID